MSATETEPMDRIVCFCFGHTAAQLLAATRADGTNRIEEEIREACRHGLDRCATTNPEGRCCLGNVRRLLRGQDGGPDCCSD